MEYPLVTVILLLACTLTRSLADVSSLQDQAQEQLDPLQDQDQDLNTNNQDKRTICAALNSCGRSNSAYVKRVMIKSGLKLQAFGYAPIRVGVKPTFLGGYRYSKPKIHFSLKAPSVAAQSGWKPVQAAVKPVVELKPGVDVIHNTPGASHVDHVAPTNVGHVHLQPLRPSYVHLRPEHVDQVHQINVPHGNHFDSFTHLDHVGAVAQSVIPTIVKPFAPSPTLFEVTRPNLGVLPLGSRFLTP
uniref:Attacin C-terminal domain-containing protein n=1 Tax=Dendroctonus ponderosae TaxID=77166 RepID=A0AAR5P7G2_DENPD